MRVFMFLRKRIKNGTICKTNIQNMNLSFSERISKDVISNQIWFGLDNSISKDLKIYEAAVQYDDVDVEVVDVYGAVLKRFNFLCVLNTEYHAHSFYMSIHPTNHQPICLIVKEQLTSIVGALKGRISVEVCNVEDMSGAGDYVFLQGGKCFDLGATIHSYYAFVQNSVNQIEFSEYICCVCDEKTIHAITPVLPLVILNDVRVNMDDFDSKSRLIECRYLLSEDSIWNQVESIEMLEVLNDIDFNEVLHSLKYLFTCSDNRFNEHYLSFESKSKEGFAIVHVSDETISVDIVIKNNGGKFDFKILVDDFSIDFKTMMLAHKTFNQDKYSRLSVCEFLKDSECFDYMRFLRMTTY